MIKKSMLCLCLSMCLLPGRTSWAEEKGTVPPKDHTVEFNSSIGFLNISLTDSIIIGLKNNLDIEISRLNPLIEDKDISVEKAAFDPIFWAKGGFRNPDDPINSAFITGVAPGELHRKIETLDVSLSMLTPIGATLNVDYGIEKSLRNTSRGVAFNPAVDTFVEVSFTQPLLKKFGIFYTRSKIYMARNDKKKSLYAFKRIAIDVVNATQRAYWDLVKAIEDLKVAHQSLFRAEEFLRSNELKMQAGILAPIDLIVDNEEVAFREERIIITERDMKDKEDVLKHILNLLRPGGDPWLAEVSVLPVDKPVFDVRDVDLDDSIRIALENRPEIFEKKFELDNAAIEARRKKSERLPQLDLEGGLRYSGLDKHMDRSQKSLLSGDFQEEFARLTVEIPIGLRKGRAEYARAKYEKRKAQLELSKQERNILLEVREAVRHLRANRRLVRNTRKTLKYSRRRLVAEEKKYSVGRTTNIEVLRAQNDLAFQETRAIRALTEHHKSQGELEAVKGTILERFNIFLEGQAPGLE
ncbi:MAG: TolC family protein [Candidatus Brocadiales bacterium]